MCENRPVARPFPTISARFKLIICTLMGDFGACDKLRTGLGLRHDLRKVLHKSSLLKEYKIQLE